MVLFFISHQKAGNICLAKRLLVGFYTINAAISAKIA